ncbi:SDR family oxidoreductase [Streptomyces sp. H28]|uniref:SDR family NAD(P)-dependent oxidoreductase n=1 Tax=Streptomyces sp. H28 TaxID=2775865 RepID=UPI0017800D3A|nr:SDR family NAD(P)-dependent oxidoreductase [Streptomyces sp. H28]MBD9735812.1 SDR family oxidoreductase [Streptomyces sp. H28]
MSAPAPDTPALHGRAGVVTGSSRGLGRAFALSLARAGMAVVLNGTDAESLRETARAVERAGGSCRTVVGSVADQAVCDALVETCVREFGRIDVLVNNAGIVRDRSVLKMTADEFDEVLAVHLRGTWACSVAAGRHLRRHGGGSIISIGSGSGQYGVFGQANYAAAKAGIAGLNRVLDLELGRHGVRCNVLAPVARTRMTDVFRAGGTAPGHALSFPEPDDVAPVVVWLASDGARHVTGQFLSFDGTELSVWTHPRPAVTVRHTPGAWTGDLFARALTEDVLEHPHPDKWGASVLPPPAQAAGPDHHTQETPDAAH